MTPQQPKPDGGTRLQVLIVQSNGDLGNIWQRHLTRMGADVVLCLNADDALHALTQQEFHVIMLDLVLNRGNALTVADMASFRQPNANVICVTDTSFFSDGSIFSHSANARLMLRRETPPEELAAIVSHYGERSVASVR